MNTLTILGICASTCLVGLGALYRYKQVSWKPFGTGFGIDSPDGRYRAHAADYVDESFCGRETTFYGFEVTDRSTGKTIARHETPRVAYRESAEGDVDFYNEVVVTWTPDSRRVHVEFRGNILWEHAITPVA